MYSGDEYKWGNDNDDKKAMDNVTLEVRRFKISATVNHATIFLF